MEKEEKGKMLLKKAKPKTITTLLMATMLTLWLVSMLYAGTVNAQGSKPISIKLQTIENGIAEWTTADKYSGNYSVQLIVNTRDGKATVGINTTTLSLTIDNITNLSFWYRHIEYNPASGDHVLGPDIVLVLRKDSTYYIAGAGVVKEKSSEWKEAVINETQSLQWWYGNFSGSLEDYQHMGYVANFTELKSVLGGASVLGVGVMLDPPENGTGSVYVDDITINDDTYVLEMPSEPPLTVDDDRAENPDAYFQRIQSAIDAAEPGDTVLVYPGTYVEKVIIDKQLTLLGAQHGVDPTVAGARTVAAEESVITCPDGDTITISKGTNNATVDGFTVTSANGDCIRFEGYYITGNTVTNNILNGGGGNGIEMFNSISNTIANNVISENLGVGIYMHGCDNNIIENNFIHDNNKEGKRWSGIKLDHSNGNTVRGNTISGQYTGVDVTGYYDPSNDNLITQNTILDNSGHGICIYGTTGNTGTIITYNTIEGNMRGISVYGNDLSIPEIHYNNIAGNTLYGVYSEITSNVNATLNWWGSAAGPNATSNTYNKTLQGDRVSGNVDFTPWLNATYPEGSSFAPVENINTTEQFASIQAAIDDEDTLQGHTILLHPGTYTATTSALAIIDKPLILRGSGQDGSNTTILDGGMYGFSQDISGIGNNWPRAIIIRSSDVTIENIKIKNFQGSDPQNWNPGGYGIVCRGESSWSGSGDTTYRGIILQDITFEDVHIGIRLNRTDGAIIQRVTYNVINGSPNYAIYATNSPSTVIRDNIINKGSIWLTGKSHNGIIVNNTVRDAPYNGIWFGMQFEVGTSSENCSIINHVVDRAEEGGIVISNMRGDSAGNIQIINNTVRGTKDIYGEHHGGISIISGTFPNLTVQGNILENNVYGLSLHTEWTGNWDNTTIEEATITYNTIKNNSEAGILINAHPELTLTLVDIYINYNEIYNNTNGIINNEDETIDARFNDWDIYSFDKIEALIHHKLDDPDLGEVVYTPWIVPEGVPAPRPPSEQKVEAITSTGVVTVVNATDVADVEISVNVTSPTSVIVANHTDNPHPEAPRPEGMLPKYVEIAVGNKSAVEWPMYVRLYYTDEEVAAAGMSEVNLGLYYFKDGSWHRCENTSVDVDNNFIWAYVQEYEYVGSPFSGSDRVSYDLTLYPGWNLMSTPLIPEDVSIEDVLGPVLDKVESVWSYDPYTKTWSVYNSDPTTPGNLTIMRDGRGYWVKMNATGTTTFSVYGYENIPGPGVPPTYTVYPGWNLVGFKSLQTVNTTDYLRGVSYVRTWAYYPWDPDKWVRDPAQMIPGLGYWIYVSEEGTIVP